MPDLPSRCENTVGASAFAKEATFFLKEVLQPADQLNPGTNAPGYIKQLDALRAFAVLAVLWSHYVPRKYSFLGINLGEFGVRLFFGLSGFLITGILLASRQRVLSGSENIASALRQFYIRRSLRIFPVFYATLAAMFLLKIPPVRETFAWPFSTFPTFTWQRLAAIRVPLAICGRWRLRNNFIYSGPGLSCSCPANSCSPQ
ncbi:MAG: acyltransferase, partial [Pseudomonadota bacterium]|nr:acyltransferase [Pseudomonadota bacterium]